MPRTGGRIAGTCSIAFQRLVDRRLQREAIAQPLSTIASFGATTDELELGLWDVRMGLTIVSDGSEIIRFTKEDHGRSPH